MAINHYLAGAFALAAIVLASILVARDVSHANNISTLQSKVSSTESAINDLNTKMTQQLEQQQQALNVQRSQASNNIEAKVQVFSTMKTTIPGVCRLDCSNGGRPDKLCENCIGCDEGFVGDRCHIPKQCEAVCSKESNCRCANAGVLSADNCACECVPGWTGATCIERDSNASNVDARRFLRRLGDKARREWLKRVIEESRANITGRAEAQSRKRTTASGDQMIPNHLGAGVDPVTRQLRAPVLEMQFPTLTAPLVWVAPNGQRYALPDRAFFELSPSYAPVMTDQMFNSMEDFVAFMQEERNKGVDTLPIATGSSLFIKRLDDLRNAFAHYENSFIAMTRSERRLYKMKLDITAAAPADTFQLEDGVSRAIDFLPPNYDTTTKELYTMFFDYWGTSFVSGVVEGGIVESIHAVHSSTCTINGRATNAFLSSQQRQFMGQFVGLPGQWTVNSEYDAKAVQDASGCSGGNAAVCEEQLRNRADQDPWVQSLWSLPAPVSFEVRSIHEIVKDPVKKQAMLAAAQEYEASHLAGISTPVRAGDFCPAQQTTYPSLPPYWHSWKREMLNYEMEMLAY